jgi:hypothetical protein
MFHGFNFPPKERKVWIFGFYTQKNKQKNGDAPSEDLVGLTL